MEKECFSLLLRGIQPIIWYPAKRLAVKGIPSECAEPLAEGRLLMLSPFGNEVMRATEKAAVVRNEFVAALADGVFIAHAVPGSKTEALCQKVLEWRKPLLTFDGFENAALLRLGASAFDVRNVAGVLGADLI